MATDKSKIVEIPTQLPGEVKPMTRSEREFRRKHADKLIDQMEELTKHGGSIRMTITPTKSD